MFIKGIVLLLITLGLFSVFSMKAPKGDKAMQGLASAAVATFLVQAVVQYILGDLLNVDFLQKVGELAGSMGGCAAAILVSINMGINPVIGIASGVAIAEYGILPGLICGYVCYFISRFLEKRIPESIYAIAGVIIIAPTSRMIATIISPAVNFVISNIGESIMCATTQSPILMGFVLGGIMKVVCTSPLSAMALTAMIDLRGLAMGIASIACVGGAFSDGTVFTKLKLGRRGDAIGVMLEPLTQADVVTKNPIPIYFGDFLAGGLSGVIAAMLGIVNDAPGTSSPIPGLIVPFAFNDYKIVILAVLGAAISGLIAGNTSVIITKRINITRIPFRFSSSKG